MKKSILMVVLSALTGCFWGKPSYGFAHAPHTIVGLGKLDSIRHFNFEPYYGQPIDSLLRLPVLQRYIYIRPGWEPCCCFRFLSLSFGDDKDFLSVDIYPPDSLVHVPKRCLDHYPRQQWSLDSIGKETVFRVKVL